MFRASYQTINKSQSALVIGDRAFKALPGLALQGDYTSATVITDTRVGKLYGKTYETLLKGKLPVHTIALQPGERSKDIRFAEQLLEFLQRKKVDRHGLLIALGGGVVGDLTGFVASVYLRGIEYIQVPTSLMAQVDSAIGGKTGVDFNGKKNIVGSFYQPKATVCDTSFLKTLPRAELINGMAEVIKYGLIGNNSLIHELGRITLARMPWEKIVGLCARTKAEVVTRDQFDRSGIRAHLNFGHTAGHALESVSNFLLPHGKAIAIGMVAAARISCKILGLSSQGCEKVEILLMQYGLPTRLPPRTNITKVMSVLQSDKKAKGGKVKWVLLEKIGKAKANIEVPEKVVREVLQGLRS